MASPDDYRRAAGGRRSISPARALAANRPTLSGPIVAYPPGDVLDQSTMKYWLDLYPIKGPRHGRNDDSSFPPTGNDALYAQAGKYGAGSEYRAGPVTRSLAAAYDAVDADKW